MSVDFEIMKDVETISQDQQFPRFDTSAKSLKDIIGFDHKMQAEYRKAFEALDTVCDPEIPVLTIIDLGVFREVSINDNGQVNVIITPTYSGCPAMNMIGLDTEVALLKAGFSSVKVNLSLSPAWSTDWMTETGKAKLVEYGIAAPVGSSSELKEGRAALFGITEVECPRCKSSNTEKVAEFGSTACKALYRCKSCLEPFDYFKCI